MQGRFQHFVAALQVHIQIELQVGTGLLVDEVSSGEGPLRYQLFTESDL